MARSLVVDHREPPATSPLLTGFLLLALVWLALGSLVAATQSDPASEAVLVAP